MLIRGFYEAWNALVRPRCDFLDCFGNRNFRSLSIVFQLWVTCLLPDEGCFLRTGWIWNLGWNPECSAENNSGIVSLGCCSWIIRLLFLESFRFFFLTLVIVWCGLISPSLKSPSVCDTISNMTVVTNHLYVKVSQCLNNHGLNLEISCALKTHHQVS